MISHISRQSLMVLTILTVIASACAAPASVSPQAPTQPSATEAATRVIQHALGETTITGTPQRIVALEWTYVEDLLALGIQPVGVADIAGYKTWVKIPVELGPQAVDVGLRGEPNLETLVSLKPDLIIGLDYSFGAAYEQISAIAPAIAFNPYPADKTASTFEEMRTTLMTIAQVTGKMAEGEAALKRLDEKIAAGRAQLEQAGLSNENFILSQIYFYDGATSARLFTDNGMAAEIVSQLGLQNGWEDEWQQYGFTTVGAETLSELDEVHFFYVDNAEGSALAQSSFKEVWDSLSFVKAGRAYPLGGDTWLFGGPLSAERLVDLVVSALTNSAVEAAFPVTIEHKYGSTTLTEAPQRIVLVGLVEQDALLALGIVPVATREWYGGRPGAIFEWAKDKLGAAPVPEVLSGNELSFERIAALKPDIIIGLYAGLTEEEYATLSQIAPTVAQPKEYVDWGIPWQELTRKIGLIVGKAAEAEQLVAEVEAKFAEARAAYPEFQGATGVVASTWGYPESYYPYSSQDARGRFITALGFTVPATIDELAGDGFGASISRERLDLVDVDMLVWLAEDDGFDTDPLYQVLNVVKEGRHVFIPPSDPFYDALNFSTVLSLPFAIDGLAPRFAAAVDGNPATVTK